MKMDVRRLERRTSSMSTMRSNQLSYTSGACEASDAMQLITYSTASNPNAILKGSELTEPVAQAVKLLK